MVFVVGLSKSLLRTRSGRRWRQPCSSNHDSTWYLSWRTLTTNISSVSPLEESPSSGRREEKETTQNDRRLKHRVDRSQQQLDFFGEPITFFWEEEIESDVSITHSSTPSSNEMRTASTTSKSTATFGSHTAIHTNFTTTKSAQSSAMDAAMAASNNMVLAIVSKGLSCVGGNIAMMGLERQGGHSVALAWSDHWRQTLLWNPVPSTLSFSPASSTALDDDTKMAPMLVVVAVTPILAQAGIAYLRHVDSLLLQTNDYKKLNTTSLPIGMYELARHTVSSTLGSATLKTGGPNSDRDGGDSLDSQRTSRWQTLQEREQWHIRVLHHLLRQEMSAAMVCLLRLLKTCPGDALALSLAMDVALTLGDSTAALRAATTVSSYWNERRGGFIRPSLPGHAMASSLIALGLAVGGRIEEAEPLAERAMKQGRKAAGGVATWAQAHIFDAGGRVAEGISALANHDGMENYRGSGLLFFESRLAGYGARFCLDREERGRGKSAALRLYATHIEEVLGYSGFAMGKPWDKPRHQAPFTWLRPPNETQAVSPRSIWNSLFGSTSLPTKPKDEDYEIMNTRDHWLATKVEGWEPSFEDVFTFLPPTPHLLSDSTLLLLRFTLNGTISPNNVGWDHLRNAWGAMLHIQKNYGYGDLNTFAFSPMLAIISSLFFPPEETGGDQICGGKLAQGMFLLGRLLKLGDPTNEGEKTTAVRELIAENSPDFWLPVQSDQRQGQWRLLVGYLAAARDGLDFDHSARLSDDDSIYSSPVNKTNRFSSWEFEARPLLEHALCYASCKAGDIESLSIARAVCSQGVTLRRSSPEEWWRYSIVLGLLGDQVGSEDALNVSINTGGGQGARR